MQSYQLRHRLAFYAFYAFYTADERHRCLMDVGKKQAFALAIGKRRWKVDWRAPGVTARYLLISGLMVGGRCGGGAAALDMG